MKTLVSIITLGLAVAFAAPAFAADKAPTSKSACEKAHRRGMRLPRSASKRYFFRLKAGGLRRAARVFDRSSLASNWSC